MKKSTMAYNDREIVAHNLILMRKRTKGGLINTVVKQSNIIVPDYQKAIAPLAYDPFSGFFLEFYIEGYYRGFRSEFARALLNISINNCERYSIDSFVGDNSFEHTPKAIINIIETIDTYNSFNAGNKSKYIFNEDLS